MNNMNKKELSNSLERLIRLFGYEGKVTIDNAEVDGEYYIYHSAFGYPFYGMSPKSDELFTVLIADHRYIDLNGFDRAYKEAIVLEGYTLEPLFYSIYKEPEFQRIMLKDFLRHKRGDILYANKYISGGYRSQLLTAPIFDFDVFDVNLMMHNVKATNP